MNMPLPTTPQKPTSVQPGGGWCMTLELWSHRWYKMWLRILCPGYVKRMQAKRQGDCPNCPHDIIDSLDLKYTRNVCGYWFKPEDDPYTYRNRLGFARHGLAEIYCFSYAYVILAIICVELARHVHGLFLIPLGLLTLVELEILYFFRDPERVIPAEPDALVSPADGTVTHIEEVEEPELGKVLRISIFLSIFNVHVNRCPFEGEVTDVRYFPGEFLDARNPESAVRNEQLWIDLLAGRASDALQDPSLARPANGIGVRMRVKQISGAIARRIVCWLKAGDVLQKGERIGMIKLGSRTDLLIPVGAAREICVKVGDSVKGGASILLKLRPVQEAGDSLPH